MCNDQTKTMLKGYSRKNFAGTNFPDASYKVIFMSFAKFDFPRIKNSVLAGLG